MGALRRAIPAMLKTDGGIVGTTQDVAVVVRL
jgi:hypothetical protein